MREILFRGLHRRKGEKVRLDGTPVESMWVYGGYCQYNEERGIIYQVEPEIHKFPVYADSVGQYTGLTDRNGTKIFEGDICKIGNFDLFYFAVTFDKYGCWKFATFGNYHEMKPPFSPEFNLKCEVVGNIYDNPELLEETK